MGSDCLRNSFPSAPSEHGVAAYEITQNNSSCKVEPGVVGDPTVSIWLEIETVASRAMNELPAMETLPDPGSLQPQHTAAGELRERCSPSTQPLARRRDARLQREQHKRDDAQRYRDDHRNINALNLFPGSHATTDFKPWRRA